MKKPIIIASCLPKIHKDAVTKVIPDYPALIDPFSIGKMSDTNKGYDSGKRNQHFFSDETTVKTPNLSRSEALEIVPIAEGCVGACTFCCTKFARGRLFSYPMEMIVESVRELVFNGTREVWLTAQDTGAYGLDRDTNLASMLEKICEDSGEVYLRVGMTNPNNILKFRDRLLLAYKSEKIFKFLQPPHSERQ